MKILTWPQRGWLWFRILIRLALLAGVIALLALAGGPLLSLLMPFLLAFFAAWLCNPVLRFFHRRWKIPRGLAAVLLLLLVTGVVGGGVFALLWKGWNELAQLGGSWNTAWPLLEGTVRSLAQELQQALSHLPGFVQAVLAGVPDRLLDWLRVLLRGLLPRTTNMALGVSSFLVAYLFFLMAAYFISKDYYAILRGTVRYLPRSLRRGLRRVKRAFFTAFGGYLRAQLILSGTVFLILLTGFFVLRQPYGVLLAFLLAMLDLIPLLGAGTALIPWAVLLFLLGDWEKGLPLLILWGVICLFRRVMEPKIVGDQTGLHPLLALFAIYAGLRFGGVLGMVLAPMVVLMLRNLYEAGTFRPAIQDLSLACRDLSAILRDRGLGR